MSSSSQLSLLCPSSPEVGHVLLFSADRAYGVLGIFLRVVGNDLYLPGPALWCWLRDGPSSAALCATCKWIRSRTATWDCYSCFRPWLWVHVDRTIVSASSAALVNATVRMLSGCLVCRKSPNMAAGVYQLLVDETYPQYGVCELVEPPPPALSLAFSQQPAASRMVPWANALEIWCAVIAVEVCSVPLSLQVLHPSPDAVRRLGLHHPDVLGVSMPLLHVGCGWCASTPSSYVCVLWTLDGAHHVARIISLRSPTSGKT